MTTALASPTTGRAIIEILRELWELPELLPNYTREEAIELSNQVAELGLRAKTLLDQIDAAPGVPVQPIGRPVNPDHDPQGRRIAARPCNGFTPYEPAPGYCQCGWMRHQHGPQTWIGNEQHNRRMTDEELAAQVPFEARHRNGLCAHHPLKNPSGRDPLLERDRQPAGDDLDHGYAAGGAR